MASHFENVASQVPTGAAPAGFMRLLWTVATRSLRSAVCGLHGHDPLLQVEGPRMFLRCASCGHETPGWMTAERRPRLRYAGDRARHRLN